MLQDRQGLVVWPWRQVACLRAELAGRLEGTSANGEVAHRPGPLSAACPLPEVAAGVRVHPRHVARVEGGLRLPDGRLLPVQAALPEPPPPEPDEVLPGTDLPLRTVRYVDYLKHLRKNLTIRFELSRTASP